MDNTQTYLIVVFVIILVLLFLDKKKSSKEHFVVNTCGVFGNSNNLISGDYYNTRESCVTENGENGCNTLECGVNGKYYFKHGDTVQCLPEFEDVDKNYFTGTDGVHKGLTKCYYN
jgi:hypothetical protein